jgi:hypothetical protein
MIYLDPPIFFCRNYKFPGTTDALEDPVCFLTRLVLRVIVANNILEQKVERFAHQQTVF